MIYKGCYSYSEMVQKYPIISSEELRKISEAISEGKEEIEVSLDLGFSGKLVKLELTKEGLVYKNSKISVPKIRNDDKSCYLILKDCLEKAQYSAGEGIYKLVPTQFRPILQVSGTSMHKQSFIERVEKDKLTGNILDSGTGLGYTAIISARTARKVTTIEFDEMVLEIQKINPYSQELFSRACISPNLGITSAERKNIELVHGDLVEEIKKFKDEEFDFIILDGGTPRSSGEFFSEKNYSQVFRVLKYGGKLYHYIPNYHINRGTDFAENKSKVFRKLGFGRVERDKEGCYLVVTK